MRILIVHNAYQHRGGEDSVVDAEIALLKSRGHEVQTYFRDNDDIGRILSASVVQQTLWSSRTTRDLAELFASFRPDIIHVHNTLPLISPSLYWAAEQAGIPVVQTLHNFRLLCLNGMFLRDGQVCEDCLDNLPWRGVARKCYRGSWPASAVLAGMLTLHRGLGTYRKKVTRYIALNDFCRQKFIQGGLPAKRIVVKPNFVNFPPPEALIRQGLLFVGRLSVEKGVGTLSQAVKLLPDARLRVAGEGSEIVLLDGLGGVTHLGRLQTEAVRQEMNSAIALVVPSISYETFGLVIIEAFACATPVIASRIGALAELVQDGVSGLLFEPGNAADLAEKIAWAISHPEAMRLMGEAARAEYEAKYTPEINYHQLMAIYVEAIAEVKMYGH
jgi:glycosyltransferase involved in cell wall biosynthesis